MHVQCTCDPPGTFPQISLACEMLSATSALRTLFQYEADLLRVNELYVLLQLGPLHLQLVLFLQKLGTLPFKRRELASQLIKFDVVGTSLGGLRVASTSFGSLVPGPGA